MSDRRTYKSIRYPFTGDEIRDLGASLAREHQTVLDLLERQKAVAAEFAASIKAAKGRETELTVKINNGYEMREVECLVLFDTPRPGMKRLVRMDNPDEQVADEAMTLAEMQGSFGWEPPDPNPA